MDLNALYFQEVIICLIARGGGAIAPRPLYIWTHMVLTLHITDTELFSRTVQELDQSIM